MTDYDPKPTAYHTQESDVDDGNGILGWIIGLLILAAILAALWWFFRPQVDVDLPQVSGGDVDVSVNPADIDVDLPRINVEGGDVDVGREGRQEVEVPDVDIEGGDIDLPEVSVEGGDVDLPEVEVDDE